MSFASLHKVVTLLLAAFGLGALFPGGELSPIARAVIVLAFAGSVFAEGERLQSRAWQRGWTVGLVVLLVIEVVRGVAGEPPLSLALEFTAALQISRLYNRRTAAEHQQITILSFLHLCAATVLSTDVAYGIVFIGFVVVAPWMLALTHLRSEIEGHYPGDPDPARAADVRRVLASRRVVGASFLVGTAALSLPLFLMTALLFVAFPRVGLGMLAFGRGRGSHVAGFGGDVELGQMGLIRDDPTVVLRVTPPGLGPTPPMRAAIRMRGTSFDHYDGRRWSRSLEGSSSLGRIDAVVPVVRIPRSTDAAWSVVLDHLDETVVFLPEGTIAIEIPTRLESGVEIGRRLVRAPGLDLRYEDDDALGLRYRALVSSDPRDAARATITTEELRVYLQLPEGHARVADLAREWTDGVVGARARADRIVSRLRAFEYSLEMRDPGDRPPLEAFLFEWREGHCEYFSSAMAVMLRSLGIPARNATGFLGGRWNAFGGYYAITNGDAHSWVEAWVEGEGWVTFDPTPPGRGEVGLAQGIFDALGEALDALRTRWEEDVVSYDLRAQRSLARRLARLLVSLGAGGDEREVAAETEARAVAPPVPWSRVLALLGALGVLALAVRSLLRRRAARSLGPSIPESAREAVALYRSLERALAALGLPRPPDRTPREHADHLARDGFLHAEAVSMVTERYLEARFGGATLSAAELATLRETVRAMERAPRA